MKLVGISALIGLASAAPIDEAQDSATIAVATPSWHHHADFQYQGYYSEDYYHTITLDEVPNSGETTADICKAQANMAEGWCPDSNDHIMRTYADLVVTHFMPLSAAAGVLDESEASNIPNLMLGYRTKTWSNVNEPAVTLPATIDNALALAERGSDSANDVYDCGPTNGGERSWLQRQSRSSTAGFVDATADSAAAPCLAIGNQGFYGADVENNFRMKNVACTETMHLVCVQSGNPGANSHGGLATSIVQMNNTNVDILKAAFNLVNDPANAPAEEEADDSSNDAGAGGDSTGDSSTEEPAAEAGMSTTKIIVIAAVVVVVAVVLFLVLGKKE